MRNPLIVSNCSSFRLSRTHKFIVMSKSALSVDKVVKREEGGKGMDSDKEYYDDAIVIGSGIRGLVASTQLAGKGARVLVLEKYVIPGGSSGYYERDGYTFDVGSSVMFGFSYKVGTPKTHRRYPSRDKGTYGPMPRGTPKGLLGMPFNTTNTNGLIVSVIVASLDKEL